MSCGWLCYFLSLKYFLFQVQCVSQSNKIPLSLSKSFLLQVESGCLLCFTCITTTMSQLSDWQCRWLCKKHVTVSTRLIDDSVFKLPKWWSKAVEFCLSVIAQLCQTACNFKSVALSYAVCICNLKNVTELLFFFFPQKIVSNAFCSTTHTSKPQAQPKT